MADNRPDIIRRTPSAADPAAADGQPAWLPQRLEWFQDLKFGLFLHWGPYCQWGCIESWPLVEADTWARPDSLPAWAERGRDLARFRRDYVALNRTFCPTRFDPADWARQAAAAGMRYVCFTTKHHDGFCMFDTATTDYRVTHPDCPFHGDPRANIARHVFDAFRARGFGISCYFSKSDWHCPWYWCPDLANPDRNVNYDTARHPQIWARFVEFAHRQVEELMTGYGPIDALWLDGGQVRPPHQDLQMARMAAMARSHQPGLLVADRTVGGPYENILTPEQQIPDRPLPQAWESCLTMGTSWSFKPNDTYKPTRELVHMLVDIVAKGGNLLLNIGPDATGGLAPEAEQRLREIGDWMRVNAEAIHGTRPVPPFKEGRVCFTSKSGVVYAIVLAAADETSPPPRVELLGIVPAPGSAVTLLGGDRPLAWRRTDQGAEVDLPCPAPCEHAWVLQFRAG